MRSYLAIDLKSFYASVECIERGLDPMTTNLVVADPSRTEKTICLAVSPSLKAYGISGRARLFEVVQKVAEVNGYRQFAAPGQKFTGKSCLAKRLQEHPELAVDYVVAPPQMARYIERSTKIYSIYLKYIAPEDIHVYSIDEVMMDVTNYLGTYKKTPRQLAQTIIWDILQTTGITATAGIGTNLFLCKVAMDILAKHTQPDAYGVRIAQLDEMSFRRELWTHRPLTDFWRIGPGYAKKLEKCGLMTMGDIARCSLGKESEFYNEEMLYKMFGVNAQLLIDHAWGFESCTMADIKAYKPGSSSLGSGQVLTCPYTAEKAKLVAREMADALSLDLVDKGLVTDQLVLVIGYDVDNLKGNAVYAGSIVTDRYGRAAPKQAHGSQNLGSYTSSTTALIEAVEALFDRIADKDLLIRRINICANHTLPEEKACGESEFEQMDLFAPPPQDRQKQQEQQLREKKRQQTILTIKKKYGKNAIVRGMNLEEGATAMERNHQIGGHKA